MDYSRRLFKDYRKSHTLQSGVYEENDGMSLFNELWERDYKHIFKSINKNARILEIGCNVGFMLKVLNEHGYENLTGIDLSPDDLEVARKILPENIRLEYADAFAFLQGDESYDVIFSKAVFEHIKKDCVMELFELCRQKLSNGGVLIVDVPNMDWLIASHERYMDFTHETGYNKDSLGQIFRSVFENCEIYYGGDSKLRIHRRLARMILGSLVCFSFPGTTKEMIFSREVIGVARKNE